LQAKRTYARAKEVLKKSGKTANAGFAEYAVFRGGIWTKF